MIGNEDQRRLGAGDVDKRPEHGVEEGVASIDHAPIERGICLRDPFEERRPIPHEDLREGLEEVVADGGKVPGFLRDQLRGDRMHGDGGGEAIGHPPRPRVFGGVDGTNARDEREQFLNGQFPRMEAELGKAHAFLHRMNAPLWQRPLHAKRRSDARDPFVDTHPEDRLGRMAGGLIDNNRAEAALCGDVPERLGGAAAAGSTPPVAADRIRLAVGEDSMTIGSHAGDIGRHAHFHPAVVRIAVVIEKRESDVPGATGCPVRHQVKAAGVLSHPSAGRVVRGIEPNRSSAQSSSLRRARQKISTSLGTLSSPDPRCPTQKTL